MPRPKNPYLLRNGQAVPGASTIAGYYKPEPAVGRLLGWARKEALAGRDHKQTLAQAADIGTVVHAMVEAKFKGLEIICSLSGEEGEKARAAFGAFEIYYLQFPIEPIAQEVSLVSEDFGYGGTLDMVGVAHGKVTLFDWKTSSGIYESHGLQVAAYAQLWNENNPLRPITGGVHIVAFTKEGELKMSRLTMADLAVLFKQFEAALHMWRRQKQIDQIMEQSQAA